MRGLAYKRFQREKHIKRKEDILRSYMADSRPHKYDSKDLFQPFVFPLKEGNCTPYWYVKHRGELNKGKIHCSCGMCSAKTRNKGKRRYIHGGNYSPAINYKISDLRKIQQMSWDEKNWLKEKNEAFLEQSFEEEYNWLRDKISEELYDSLKDSYQKEVIYDNIAY